MKKRTTKKLTLSRQTIRRLDAGLGRVRGGSLIPVITEPAGDDLPKSDPLAESKICPPSVTCPNTTLAVY